jgi:heavy metal translocating P-type ATPase
MINASDRTTKRRLAVSLRLLYLGGTVTGVLAGVVTGAVGLSDLSNVLLGVTALAGLASLTASFLQGLRHGKVGVDVIALLAIAGAVALGEYLAGGVIGVMLATGLALEDYAKARAERELTALLERTPRVVHRYDGQAVLSVSPDDVAPGDLLMVKPGEVVPVDGTVMSDLAILDEASLTGEAELVQRPAGDRVSSGVVNAGPPFDVMAVTTATQSTYAGIVRLVAEGQRTKAPFVRLADRYALVFIPATLLLAGGAWLVSGDPVRALAVLVVATPCPLILAAPIAIVSGISQAARRGVIIKGGGALETLAGARVLLFDKTGTLTMGRPAVTDIEAPMGIDADELLCLAASIEQMSPHVLAGAVVRSAREHGLSLSVPGDVVEETGMGVRGTVAGHEVAVGRLDWVSHDTALPQWVRRLRRRLVFDGFANTFVAVDGALVGALILEDPIRPDTSRTLRTLRRDGIERVVMVTGDRADVAESVGAIVGVDAVLAERTPAEKVEAVKEERAHGTTIMVGDGINDAPALAAADVGVALGARGATASSEAADVVLLVDRLDRLAEAIQVSKRARGIALQSVVAGMCLSITAMLVAAAGYLAPVSGALLQEGIDAAVIVNALRALGGYRRRQAASGPTHALADRFRAEHSELLPFVNRLRIVADQLETFDASTAANELRAIHEFLVNRLLPHEEAEEKAFYPKIAELLGGEDPTGTMSRAHVEIAHQVRVLGSLLDDLGARSPDATDFTDFRRVLYGLHAILRLHFAQEEEAYLSLVDILPHAEGSPPVRATVP